MPYTILGKDAMLDSLGVTHVSAHTADPGESGINEVSGGSYTRESISFSGSSGGNLDSSSQPQISIPGDPTTVTHIGFWTASSGGTLLGYKAIPSETFNNDGTLTITDVNLDLNL
jgi:hypothetical protein